MGAPADAGLFHYSSNGAQVTESGVPSTCPTTHARIFIDTSSGHDARLAIGSPGSETASIVLTAYQMDGSSPAGSGQGTLRLDGKGHLATFVGQKIAGLPVGFRGVPDIASDSPISALRLRSPVNERDEFLMATFPVADMNKPSPAPIIFPQLVDGNGFVAEIIFLSGGQSCTLTTSYFDDAGAPLQIAK
jgi:hypothetical protein